MNRRTMMIVVAVIVIVVLVAAISMLTSQDQTTQAELLPGTVEPSPTTEQVLEDEPAAVVPAN